MRNRPVTFNTLKSKPALFNHNREDPELSLIMLSGKGTLTWGNDYKLVSLDQLRVNSDFDPYFRPRARYKLRLVSGSRQISWELIYTIHR